MKSCVGFRYQGQYEDVETGAYYNRHRYYDPDMGMYISQDPIGLAGNNPNIYAYTKDVNAWVDPFGLDCDKVNLDTGTVRAMMEGSSEAIETALKNKKLHISDTAFDEISNYAKKYGREADLDDLMTSRNITRVADNPSKRATDLVTTKKVGDSDKIIFGTGDELDMTTITSDAKFVRGASAQGVDFDVIIHPPH